MAHMPEYSMPQKDLANGLSTMILYGCLHFQDLRGMEKTSRWDGTDGDVTRIADRRPSTSQKGASTVHSSLVACLSGAGFLCERGTSDKMQGAVKEKKASHNQPIAQLLSEAPMSLSAIARTN
jgi:hypothetical protein